MPCRRRCAGSSRSWGRAAAKILSTLWRRCPVLTARGPEHIVTSCAEAQPIAGWSSLVARRAHNPKVAGSNPAPATIESQARGCVLWPFSLSVGHAAFLPGNSIPPWKKHTRKQSPALLGGVFPGSRRRPSFSCALFAETPLRSHMATATQDLSITWPGHGSRVFRVESYGGGRLSIEPVLSQGLRQNRS